MIEPVTLFGKLKSITNRDGKPVSYIASYLGTAKILATTVLGVEPEKEYIQIKLKHLKIPLGAYKPSQILQ